LFDIRVEKFKSYHPLDFVLKVNYRFAIPWRRL